MIINSYFQISGLFIIVFLLKVYFSTKRKKSLDNNIFLILIFTNLLIILTDILNNVLILNLGSKIINIYLEKIILSLILIWMLTLTLYVYVNTLKKKERLAENYDLSIKKVIIRLSPFIFILLIATLILPLDLLINRNLIFFKGPAIHYVCFMSLLFVLFWIYRVITRSKFIKKKNSRLILALTVIVFITIILQLVYPEFLLTKLAIYFLTFVMYFDIDKCDMELVEEINYLKKTLDETEASRTDMLLKASHEIRTPLNTILGFSESILEGSSENILEDVGYIKGASEVLLNSVNNILNITNTKNTEVNLIYNEYNFDNFIKQISAVIKSKLESKNVEFKLKMNNTIPQMLYGDNIRLKQALINVLYNSVKYTKEGYISLDINSITIGNVCRLIINIKDTGIGIPEEKFNKLFKENYSDKKNLDEESEIDLVNIKKILESMGGKIFIESEYSEGTSVKISVDQQIIETKEEKPAEVEEKTTKDKKEFSDKRILIVDDDLINLKVAERLLKQYKLNIETVSSGIKCLEKIDNGEKYDLIFMDDMMPEMTGTETLRQLHNTRGFDIPVVALTANAMYGMKENYIKKGFDDYLSKPIDRKELDKIIKKFLD